MSNVTRHIGLSLGADICWPLCFEEILKRLDLKVKLGGNTVSFDVNRVTIEPFDLAQDVTYDVVLDRLTHWYHTSREWVKKAVLMNGLYVLNNPWTIQSMEKHTTYVAMMRLGLPIPKTWLVPPKSYDQTPDLQPTLERYAKLFDLGEVGKKVGYPLFMKPYDGGAWRGVSKIDNESALKAAYDVSGKNVMHLQKAVAPFDLFVRALGVGPQVRVMKYDPAAPLHDRYVVAKEAEFVSAKEREHLAAVCLTINAFFGWDFNSCESLKKGGTFHPIDFANACPDSQVTSLHYHFPWLVKAKLRWAIYAAATKRKFRHDLNWAAYFKIADEDGSFEDKLAQYAKLAAKHFETDKFEEFCAKHLKHLDAVAHEFFSTPAARDAVHKKVQALYPQHEWAQFTDLFFARIQKWRDAEK